MTKGKYIVIEGAEGVGKTTQIQLIAAQLQAAGLPVRVLREPDSQSDLTARTIRTLTQDPRYPMNTRTEVLLYNAARSQSLEVIRRSIEQGVYCLVDRNYLTTLAIQYYGRGDVPEYDAINSIISFAVGGMEPDLTVILDAPVSALRERVKHRYQGERFDNLDEAFLERVRAGYLWEAKQRGLPVVHAVQSAEEVFRQVWQHVTATIAERTPIIQDSPADDDTRIVDAQPHVATVIPTRAASVEPPVSIKEVLEIKHQTLVEQGSLEAAATEPTTEQEQKQDPNQEPNPTPAAATTSAGPLIRKNKNGSYTITKAGKNYLEAAVTNSEGNVYAFTDALSPTTIAAAMARLSRRGDDMRVTILDEFSGQAGKDAKLLQRVITAYGDDSVQQLVGIHFVVENASQLLTKKLEWGRLAAYLEQSTRYIYFDQKDSRDRYKYHMPRSLKPVAKQHFKRSLDEIFDTYSVLVRKLTSYIQEHSRVPKTERDGAWKAATRAQACDAVRPVLPVATTSTVGIFASGQALESLIMHLQADELAEATTTGQHILDEARKVMPTFLERADKPDRGGATIAYAAQTRKAVKALADTYLPATYSPETEPVQLTGYWPANELDLVADMVYEHASMSLKAIKQQLGDVPYETKQTIFKTYVGERLNRRHRPGRALEKAHYSWDIVCDYGIFRDLQRHRMVDDLEWQQLTPRYGFDIPEIIEQAGLVDDFEHCFDISAELYSYLQAEGYELEAQYATLLGHRMRWKITYNAREAFHFHELRTSPQGHPGYRKLVQQMHEKLAEVHPLMAESMRFVNSGEDPELTRLAAERATQFKLDSMR